MSLKTFFLTLLSLTASFSLARTFCNKSVEIVSIAGRVTKNCTDPNSAFTDPVYCTTSAGWYSVKPGECKDLNYRFFYAEGSNGNVWSGNDDNLKGCIVPRRRFEIEGQGGSYLRDCTRKGGKVVRFLDMGSLNAYNFLGGRTIFKLCNRRPRTVFFALAKHEEDSGWVSSGWYEVAVGGCEEYKLPSRYSDKVYWYANDTGGTVWRGSSERRDPSFCMDSKNKFKFKNADYYSSCGNNPAFKYERFRTLDRIRPGTTSTLELE